MDENLVDLDENFASFLETRGSLPKSLLKESKRPPRTGKDQPVPEDPASWLEELSQAAMMAFEASKKPGGVDAEIAEHVGAPFNRLLGKCLKRGRAGAAFGMQVYATYKAVASAMSLRTAQPLQAPSAALTVNAVRCFLQSMDVEGALGVLERSSKLGGRKLTDNEVGLPW
eukprot:scaffold535_cov260-Pinguiococcus_pyrenoidosus.AAC.9